MVLDLASVIRECKGSGVKGVYNDDWQILLRAILYRLRAYESVLVTCHCNAYRFRNSGASSESDISLSILRHRSKWLPKVPEDSQL